MMCTNLILWGIMYSSIKDKSDLCKNKCDTLHTVNNEGAIYDVHQSDTDIMQSSIKGRSD